MDVRVLVCRVRLTYINNANSGGDNRKPLQIILYIKMEHSSLNSSF
jgi:hypothetical protein